MTTVDRLVGEIGRAAERLDIPTLRTAGRALADCAETLEHEEVAASAIELADTWSHVLERHPELTQTAIPIRGRVDHDALPSDAVVVDPLGVS